MCMRARFLGYENFQTREPPQMNNTDRPTYRRISRLRDPVSCARCKRYTFISVCVSVYVSVCVYVFRTIYEFRVVNVHTKYTHGYRHRRKVQAVFSMISIERNKTTANRNNSGGGEAARKIVHICCLKKKSNGVDKSALPTLCSSAAALLINRHCNDDK